MGMKDGLSGTRKLWTRDRLMTWGRSAVITCCLLLLVSQVQGRCPENNKETLTLKTTEGGQLRQEIMAAAGQEDFLIDCCTSSRNKLSWFRWNKSAWVEYPWDKEAVYSIRFLDGHNNQTLLIKHPFARADTGLYICRSTDSQNNSVEHTFNITFVSCSRENPPLMIDSEQGNIRHVELGDNSSVLCAGYFGCPSSVGERRQAYWERGGVRLNNTDSRYHILDNESVGNVNMSSELTITNVQTEDLDRSFTCVLDAGDGSDLVRRDVQLREKPKGKTVPIWKPVWTAVILLGILLVLLGVFIAKITYPQIIWCLKSAFRYCTSYKKGPLPLMLMYSEENSCAKEFAEDICKPYLENEGFRCKSLQDLPFGSDLECIGEAVRNSSAIIPIFTKNSISDQEYDLLLDSARQEKHIAVGMFVSNQNDSSENLPVLKKDVKQAYTDVKQKYKGLKMFFWPGEATACCQQERKNFWCNILLKLPIAAKKVGGSNLLV